MRNQIKLGRVFGIEVGLHYSWLIIAALIAFSLAAQFHQTNPQWSSGEIWASAIITSVLFFACLIAHEISHSLVAALYGIPVRQITLFALGGVAQTTKEATSAAAEFWIAIAGPIMSWVLGLALFALAHTGGWVPHSSPSSPLLAVLVWLGYINLVLGTFNMIPGFPLDGGRVLRAIIWWTTGNARRAMHISVRIGQFCGIVLLLYGIFRFFTGAGFGGLWLSFIGWFVLEAAGSSYVQFEASTALRDLHVSDLMSQDCIVIDGGISVQQFVDEKLLRSAQRCFFVLDQSRLAGLVTPQDLHKIPRASWPFTPLSSIMRRVEEIKAVAPETSVMRAMEIMVNNDINQIPVVSDHHLTGMISRSSILRLLRSRVKLAA